MSKFTLVSAKEVVLIDDREFDGHVDRMAWLHIELRFRLHCNSNLDSDIGSVCNAGITSSSVLGKPFFFSDDKDLC